MKLKKLISIGLVLLACVGCYQIRTIYVPPHKPVRLAQDLSHIKVLVADKDGVWQESYLDLKEGWYILSDESK